MPHAAEREERESSNPLRVFYSYSHRDEELRHELDKHLSLLKRQRIIEGWHDREISAGSEWQGQISEHLQAADIILLLVSADFIASDYCYDLEMTCAMSQHEAGKACVIPIVLRPCDWEAAPFSKLQALPTNAKPVVSWSDQDEAFTIIARGIRRAIERRWAADA